ncbi:LADA_0C05974g1_1 [Lachancea dasiensis]|uniref:non-specific serine/threonine protein kinase n=1 Tax=Lachancea dasiensis TaxID=1072105 RepID=A0A1G4IZQ4_9SACH|nr:LADA_0C05974g1_1 [Lachancea dasiensis]
MPSLLVRNVFHHGKGSQSPVRDSGSPPPTDSIRSSRSFLGFLNNTSSRDSAGSDTTHEQGSHPKRSGGSMNELKRFFRPAMLHGRGGSQTNLRNRSADHHSHTQSAIPPSSDSTLSLSNRVNIYHDDAILVQKYGNLGKVLGSGAGGSVRVITRPSDGATFAVKEFRPRKPNELVKDYAKKCTAEFCIGSTLHHPNVIETLDIFSDAKQSKYYEVMEYCPIDFFAVVMSGKMTRGEINCCLRQLTEGVKYLHSMGLAHRDLKLDNCVMTIDGVLKLIDFGSAVVFKYPFDSNVSMAHGIVGSDPYLAPEVMTSTKCYNPQPVDIWSIGIIYCCMMLKRFPWKSPKQSDENFRLFSLPDDIEHDYERSAQEHEILMKQRRQEKQRLKKLKEEGPVNDRVEELRLSGLTIEQSPPHSKGRNIQSEDGASNAKTAQHHPTQVSVASDEKTCAHETIVSEEKQFRGDHDVEGCDKPTDAKAEGHAKPKGNDSENISSKSEHQRSGRIREQGKGKKVLHGPYRLLRLLPHASRPIMSRILTIDPAERATLEDLDNDAWFSSIPYCTNEQKKYTIKPSHHVHTIVSEDDAHIEQYKQTAN